MKLRGILPLILLTLTVLFFFHPFYINGKLPLPSDTIIGLYHPFRDYYAKDYPNGIPYKNSLITDPVRQQFPWRNYASILEENHTLPLWNPYSFSGTPLLANFQSAVFYPFNILLLLPDFQLWWSIMILLQPLLAGIFMYLYLKEQKLNIYSSFLGAFTFAFCGVMVAWLEWGNIGHTLLWLPIILLSIDKIFSGYFKLGISKTKKLWYLIFIFTLSSSFFAGYLQAFFYLYLVIIFYFLARWIQHGRRIKTLLLFLLLNFCFLILTSIQWIPTLQFIAQSARDIDQIAAQKEGWYLPPQHLIQFIAPDFFGNPATLNYWGVWNYGEFLGYVSILPLVLALFALFYRYDRKTLFFGSIFFLSLIFALPTWFAKIPFELKIPLLSTSQPTRLLFLTDFSLAVLAALGLDFFMKLHRKIKIIYPMLFILLGFILLWSFIFITPYLSLHISIQDLTTAKHNLYLPTIIYFLTAAIFLLILFIRNKKFQKYFLIIFICVTIFDLFRFAYKFTPFTDPKYLFPDTLSIYLIRKISGYSRIMTTDSRILPPNFSAMYFLQSIDGYDPLYLRRYGELIAAMERNKPDINLPFGFNRIITPHNYKSKIASLLGVKYILSLDDLSSPNLQKVFHEGQTKIYENLKAFDRVFFTTNILSVTGKQEAINAMFDEKIDLKHVAIVEGWDKTKTKYNSDNAKAEINLYKSDEVIINTSNSDEGLLLLTDTFYPAWHAKICSKYYTNCYETKIYRTDYNFRGVIVPPGKHSVIFYITLI